MNETQAMSLDTFAATIQPLTDEQQQHALAAADASRALLARQLAKRGGKPFDESWPLIRAAREERSEVR